MNSIEKRINELNSVQEIQQRSHWMNDLHPLGKLLISVIYIFLLVSVDKYDITSLIFYSVYLIFVFIVGELSVFSGLYRMRLILPLLIFAGVFNPFFDREILIRIGNVGISGGVISMVSLMIKGIYTVLAVYALIAVTSIEEICLALRMLHLPKDIVIVIMLIYRYLTLMTTEADKIMTAYRLRAPRQKGIKYNAWGTLVGQWLLRCMDRAENVYESMQLRGFRGDFISEKRKFTIRDILYLGIWLLVFAVTFSVR